MKSVLYAVRNNTEWMWNISLDMRVDFSFWPKQFGGRASFLQLSPPLSLGQAMLWKEALESMGSSSDRKQRLDQLRRMGKSSGFDEQLLRSLCFIETELSAGSGLAENVPELDEVAVQRIGELLQGRFLLYEELHGLMTENGLEFAWPDWKSYVQAASLLKNIKVYNGFAWRMSRKPFSFRRKYRFYCRRCGSGENGMFRTECPSCGGDCLYCETCLMMGRTRFCSLLLSGAEDVKQSARQRNSVTSVEILKRWNLSAAQSVAAQSALAFLTEQTQPQTKSPFLIWAVTGAGKTEMMFPLIETELRRGGRVLIATPRRDVVLELLPRLRQAFIHRSIVALYGGSAQRWEEGDIFLATTHQLLRFQHKFDLAIIDEIDAFPFHNNPVLEYAVSKAIKRQGKYVLLTATPPRHLQTSAKRKRIANVIVPVRYHQHPLPVPRRVRDRPLSQIFAGQSISRSFWRCLDASLSRGAQVFIFVPRINDVLQLTAMLKQHLSMIPIEGISSQDPQRTDKVRQFRQGLIRVLVTTTVMERGVTVPKTDVIVMQANSPLFDEAALIQMSGRAGRSTDDPDGRVYFLAPFATKSQLGAVRHIRRMNKLAREKGYFCPQSGR